MVWKICSVKKFTFRNSDIRQQLQILCGVELEIRWEHYTSVYIEKFQTAPRICHKIHWIFRKDISGEDLWVCPSLEWTFDRYFLENWQCTNSYQVDLVYIWKSRQYLKPVWHSVMCSCFRDKFILGIYLGEAIECNFFRQNTASATMQLFAFTFLGFVFVWFKDHLHEQKIFHMNILYKYFVCYAE